MEAARSVEEAVKNERAFTDFLHRLNELPPQKRSEILTSLDQAEAYFDHPTSTLKSITKDVGTASVGTLTALAVLFAVFPPAGAALLSVAPAAVVGGSAGFILASRHEKRNALRRVNSLKRLLRSD